MHSPIDWSADTALLHRLADAASEAILPRFRIGGTVDNKLAAGFDPVTAADRDAEMAMRGILRDSRPDDGIIGEEFGAERPDSARQWVLDPIDGTRAFITGLPTWGVLIALKAGDAIPIGMMDQPYVGERFWSDGRGAWWRRGGSQRPLRTRPCRRLSDAMLLSTSPDLFSPDERPRFEAIARAVRAVRYGTDCYGYAMIASGEADLVVESGLKLHDIAPFVPLIAAAGGVVSHWSGAPVVGGGSIIAAGDPRVAAEALAILSGH